jgi:uncharacterized protein (TIGR02271 family)
MNTPMNTRTTNAQQGGIAALYHDNDQAEDAVKQLRDAGFTPDQIGVAGAQTKGKGFFDKVSDFFSGSADETYHSDFAGSLSQLDVPRDQAGYFEQSIAEGGTLVIVRADGPRRADAVRILQQHGDLGSDLSRRKATQGTRPSESTLGEQRIRLLGETLRVHKDRVARGEVRLRKEVITEQQNVQVPVTREELVVERVSGQGRDAGPNQAIGEEQEIRVPLTEERVRVEKRPIVNEEISVGKRQVQDTKQVSDTLRREQVRVEPEGDVSEAEVQELPKKRRTA